MSTAADRCGLRKMEYAASRVMIHVDIRKGRELYLALLDDLGAGMVRLQLLPVLHGLEVSR